MGERVYILTTAVRDSWHQGWAGSEGLAVDTVDDINPVLPIIRNIP